MPIHVDKNYRMAVQQSTEIIGWNRCGKGIKKVRAFLPGSLCEKKYFRSASFSDRKGIVTGSYCGGSGLTKTSFYHMLCLIIF